MGHGKCLRLITLWVGGVKKGPKHAYVIFEWSLRNCEGTNSHIDRDLDFESVKIITDFCKNLREIDFSGSIGSTNSGDSIRYLVNNITTNIEKIDFGNVTNIDDDNVRILVQRFYELENNHA